MWHGRARSVPALAGGTVKCRLKLRALTMIYGWKLYLESNNQTADAGDTCELGRASGSISLRKQQRRQMLEQDITVQIWPIQSLDLTHNCSLDKATGEI